MRIFKQSKSNFSDYKNLLEIYAEQEYQTFADLPTTDQKEIIAAWLVDENHEDESLEIMQYICKQGILSELMYDGITSEEAGEYIKSYLMTCDHIKSINSDMDEAFGDYLMTCDGYESDNDAHRLIDNIDRVACARMGF